MRAAHMFVQELRNAGVLSSVTRLCAEMFGSLGATGKGHATDNAVILGLLGHAPDTVNVEYIEKFLCEVRDQRAIAIDGGCIVNFNEATDLILHHTKTLTFHPNGMSFCAFSGSAQPFFERTYYSVGGGFIVTEEEVANGSRRSASAPDADASSMSFHSAAELLSLALEHDCSLAAIMMRYERRWRNDEQTRQGVLQLWHVMQQCVERGCRTQGVLPGGFKVRRRAAVLYERLRSAGWHEQDPLQVMDWVNLYALAVNEENAAGGRVVTAPTNGAAGIIPAVLHYYTRHVSGACENGVIDFLLTAGAIGLLYKENASISGAEVGCQGEVGVACSMAAAGLCAVLGGSPAQVENAAEIAMEHHLGLTCDPVGGLVQIPCIERNAVASVKAINAARMALHGDGIHHVSLDNVIKTMRETGHDMLTKYKETSQGGLAVNIVAC